MRKRVFAVALVVALAALVCNVVAPRTRAAADLLPMGVFLGAAMYVPASVTSTHAPGEPVTSELKFSIATTARVPTNIIRANFSITKVSNKAGISYYPPASTGSVLLKGGGASNTVSLTFTVNGANTASGELIYKITLDNLEMPEGLNVIMISPIELQAILAVKAPAATAKPTSTATLDRDLFKPEPGIPPFR